MPTKPGFVTRFFEARGFRVMSVFGIRPDPFGSSGSDFHTGIDFGGKPRGTPVESPVIGTVFAARMYTGWGNLVAITDARGYNHLFAHLDQILVSPGGQISRGDVVGTVGSTGWTTGPHLHYQINRPGTAVRGDGYAGNPDDYIFEDEVMTLDTAIVLGGDPDYFIAAPLRNRLNCPVFARQALGSLKLFSKVIICGGPDEDVRQAAPSAEIISLSGADRFETAVRIKEYMDLR